MKGVTTLSDKKRLADAANESDLSDFEFDLPTVQTNTLPAPPAESKSLPLEDFALSLRSFDEYAAFLSPLGYAGTKAEELCFAMLSSSFGFQHSTLDDIRLNIFEQLHTKRSMDIPMDQLCELCFREDEELSSESLAYVLQLTNQNETLGDWVWSYPSVLNVLQLIGCDEIMVPCDTVEVWSLSSGDLESKETSINVYLSKQAHEKMGILLKLIASSYSRPHNRAHVSVEKKEETAKLLVVLLRLSCDATIQELYPQPMQSACRAVLAHCRSLEAIDRYTKRSENTVVNASSPMETTCFAATADTMAGATEVNSSASASDKTSVQMDISHHTEARDFVSTEDMHSQEEQEESQLSSQLHEATLSAPGSPTMGHTSSQQGEDRGVDGVGAEHTEKEGKISQEVEFLYTSQELGSLDTGNMSVILLHVLLSMVRCQDITMLTLAQAAQILNFSGDPAYHGLWEHFVQAILQYRIAPYFPQLSPPTVPLHVSWASFPTSSASNSESNTEEKVLSPGKNVSICAYMVQCIRALTAQPARAKYTHPRESIFSNLKTVRGFFKVVSQYVLFYGERIEAEDLEDLEEACGKFRKKTVSMEAEDVLDYILNSCAMYLD